MPFNSSNLTGVAFYFPDYNATLRASLAAAVDAKNDFYASTDREELIALFTALQRPKRCSSARFMILDDFEEQTGMGMSFHFLHCILLQSLWERRTLVFASSVLPGLRGKWRWCSEGSSDWSCYFEPWSPCEGYLSRRHFKPLTDRPFPPWEPNSQNLDKRIVTFWQAKDKSRQAMGRIYKIWDDPLRYSPPLMGRSWWFSITFSVLLRLTPFLERAAVKFLEEENGMKRGERLAVAFVRHGAKKHEESLVASREYEKPLLRALAPNCSNTRHLLIVTESPKAIAEMTSMCTAHGWHCFYTNQTRLQSEAVHGFQSDIWNPRGFKAHSARQPAELIGHYGWHSALNLAIAQRATYMVGSMGSLWMRMSTVFAHRFHGEPISVCSLRWVHYRTSRWNSAEHAELCSEKCATHPPACSRRTWTATGEW